METLTCPCTVVLEAADQEKLVEVVLRHTRDAHPDLPLSDTQLRNWVEAQERLTGGTERLPEIPPFEVRAVGAQAIPSILSFFDHDAFADNAGWASCYCVFHHFGGDHAGWGERRASTNRDELTSRIEAGTTTGAVAYVDDKVVGWVNASPMTTYPHHVDDDHGGFDVADVGAIACFVIAPPYRGHGIARELLDAACRQFADRGLKAVEAYPVKEPQNAASAYHGPMSLLLEAGFEVVGENGPQAIVRKVLA